MAQANQVRSPDLSANCSFTSSPSPTIEPRVHKPSAVRLQAARFFLPHQPPVFSRFLIASCKADNISLKDSGCEGFSSFAC